MPVWDDIRRSAESLIDESSKLGRIAKLKTQVKGLESELGDKVYDLGTRCLDLHRRNELHHTELEELFVEIRVLQREIKDRESEVDELTSAWRAGSGGAKPAAREACPDCGGSIRDEDRFCRHCGYDLKGR